jgi:hypothetical protein
MNFYRIGSNGIRENLPFGHTFDMDQLFTRASPERSFCDESANQDACRSFKEWKRSLFEEGKVEKVDPVGYSKLFELFPTNGGARPPSLCRTEAASPCATREEANIVRMMLGATGQIGSGNGISSAGVAKETECFVVSFGMETQADLDALQGRLGPQINRVPLRYTVEGRIEAATAL